MLINCNDYKNYKYCNDYDNNFSTVNNRRQSVLISFYDEIHKLTCITTTINIYK